MKKDLVKTANVPQISINEAVKDISELYCTAIEKRMDFKRIPSVMLWGPPGVGKSQAVREISDKIKKKTGKKIIVTDVRLLLFNPIDLRGIPTSNADKTLAIWLKPQIFQMSDAEDTINILFLDEISAAPQSVQASAYQITLDRTVGEHRLPDNCFVIAAGNRTTDKSVSFKMPKALANRLLHLEIETSYASWKKWAAKSGINEQVIDFLGNKKSDLMKFDTSEDDVAFATPRTWEMVSNILNSVSNDINDVFNLIAGLIGLSEAIEFRDYCEYKDVMPDVKQIFEGIEHRVPKGSDVIYTLVNLIKEYASECMDDMSKIRNSIIYAYKLPTDYSVMLMKEYLSMDGDFKMRLMEIPEFAKWIDTNGSLLNGFI